MTKHNKAGAGCALSNPSSPTLGALFSMLPAASLLAICLVFLVIATVVNADAKGRYLVVMRDPFPQAAMMDIVFGMGGGVTGFTRFGNGLYAISDDPGFAAAMRSAGARIVWPLPIIPGCFGSGAVRR